jgi:two-component system sensor histidine kinase HydH
LNTTDPAAVSQLLKSVIDVTGRLQTTHDVLQARVGALTAELAAANEKLRRSRDLAALGEMAAGIAHEIRNPLAAIRLDVDLLADDPPAREERAAAVARIRGAVNRLSTIVTDVLAFARDATIRRAPVAARSLLEAAAESCSAMLRGSGIRLLLEPPAPELELVGDTSLLIQAISNVVRNAVEALLESPRDERWIRIRVEFRRLRMPGGEPAERVAITVEDNGPGIAPDVVRRMFNPFFTTRRAGTGLGLAIVHRIVDAHGGEIGVTTSPGEGTSVSLCLPLMQDATHEPDTRRR